MIDLPKPSRHEIVCRILLRLCVVGFVAAWFAGFFAGVLDQVSLLWFSLVGTVIFGAGGLLSRRMMRKYAQESRDVYALRLLRAIRSGQIAQFAVFLRPFYVTGRMQIRVAKGMTGNGMPIVVRYDLEESLVEALSIPVLALGNPGEVYGVGRILTDEESWKSAVIEMVQLSSLIICMPSGHPGTRWELDQIIRLGYLEKVVFIMPNMMIPFHRKLRSKIRHDWNAAEVHMESLGLKMPPFQRAGMLFSIRPTLGVFIEELRLDLPQELSHAIRRLSEPIPSSVQFMERTISLSPKYLIDRAKAILKQWLGRYDSTRC